MTFNEQEPDTLQNFQHGRGFILNTNVAQENMEVASSTVEFRHLRRSISIPSVNGFGDNSQGFQVDPIRMRRNSSPFLNQHGLLFLPLHSRASANRIFQIKQEEGMDIASREAMHERGMHTAMQISQNWEECLNLHKNTTNSSTIRNIKLNPVSPVASLTKKLEKNSHDRQTF